MDIEEEIKEETFKEREKSPLYVTVPSAFAVVIVIMLIYRFVNLYITSKDTTVESNKPVILDEQAVWEDSTTFDDSIVVDYIVESSSTVDELESFSSGVKTSVSDFTFVGSEASNDEYSIDFGEFSDKIEYYWRQTPDKDGNYSTKYYIRLTPGKYNIVLLDEVPNAYQARLVDDEWVQYDLEYKQLSSGKLTIDNISNNTFSYVYSPKFLSNIQISSDVVTQISVDETVLLEVYNTTGTVEITGLD